MRKARRQTDFIEGGKGGGKEAQNQMKGRDECVLLFIVLAVWRSR